MRFNENGFRRGRESPGGTPMYSGTYKKCKKGRATVRKAKVTPTYSSEIPPTAMRFVSKLV